MFFKFKKISKLDIISVRAQFCPQEALPMTAVKPISVHPSNPHYFSYGGKPIILISSGDIYYDVFSPSQDFRVYLDTLASYGNNFTRMYPAGCTAFVPADGADSILPWVKLKNGKFDLDRWNPAYFRRLHDFMGYARKKGVIVDACMFNGFTVEWAKLNNHCWPLLPFNPANNIQGEGCSNMDHFTSLLSPSNVKRQKEYIRKICGELSGYDNLIYDTSDEPDCLGNLPIGLSNAWVEVMLEELHSADRGRHLIAQTHIPAPWFESGGKDWCKDRRTSWTNAEYIRPLQDLPRQYALKKPFVSIETLSPGQSPAWKGYWDILIIGSKDHVSSSRIPAWAFLTGGGAGYLEWSANYHPKTPKGTPPQEKVLRQFRVLKDFLYGFDFAKMYRFTDFGGVKQAPSEKPSAWAAAIAQKGKQYALYLSRSCVHNSYKWYNGYYAACPGSYKDTIKLKVPAGSYRVEWINPSDGKILQSSVQGHNKGGSLRLRTPPYKMDIALRMKRS
jgi:hypothetical protein